MRSGLETTSNRNYGAWSAAPSWVRFVLAQPLLTPPGAAMDYSTGSTHLLSAILTKATRKTTLQFARRRSARRSGSRGAVDARPAGHLLRRQRHGDDAAAMLALGELCLREGAPAPRRCCRRSGSATRGCRGAGRCAAIARPRVRLRLVDADAGRSAHVLRLGIRRSVHLRGAGAGAGGRHHVHGHRRASDARIGAR